jgi:hypothetical protein
MKRLRAQVFLRAEDACEACGRYIDFASGRLDHFFGRAKAAQSPANCWALCVDCDTRKTVNAPSAAWWLGQFILHASKHCFEAEAERAAAKLQVLRAKGLVAA